MPRVVVTAQVEDSAKWEENFRTHAALFKSQTIAKPIHFTLIEGNEIAVLFEPENLDMFLTTMASQATADAMKVDGVKKETVKIFVLNKELPV